MPAGQAVRKFVYVPAASYRVQVLSFDWTVTRFGVSAFYVGTVASGFEPENLATRVAAAAGNLPQIALGSVIGSAIFRLTGGVGAALLLVPMAYDSLAKAALP
jgi:Ca2+/Na+ antiporter